METAEQMSAFSSDFFSISPSKGSFISPVLTKQRIITHPMNLLFVFFCPAGEIWPNSTMDFSVEFTPTFEQQYTATSYLEVQGRDSRLPLFLKGQGIGPRAVFSVSTLDIGPVYVNTVHYYELKLKNVGDIETHYQLGKASSPIGSRFKFLPESGTLALGEEHTIEVTFTPDSLGDIDIKFDWILKVLLDHFLQC